MASFPLTLSLAPFPTGSAMDADQFGQQLIANLTATLNGNILVGQTGGTAPTSNIGPWFDGNNWEIWNTTLMQYVVLTVPSGTVPTINIGPWFDGVRWRVWNNAVMAYTPIISPVDNSVVDNGQLRVWQRGTAFAAAANATYTADRFLVSNALATGVASVTRIVENIPAGLFYPFTEMALRMTVTTASVAGLGVGEYFFLNQKIERQVAMQLFGNTSSFSILLKSNVAGTFCFSLTDSGGGSTYIQECTLTSAGVFQLFQFPGIPTFPLGTGNWGTLDTDVAYIIRICAAAGSTFTTSAEVPGVPQQWVAGNFVATTNQTNLFTAIGNYLEFTLVRHEPGSTCNPFFPRSFSEDLQSCQRCFSTSYDYGVAPGSVSALGAVSFLCATASNSYGACRYPVEMRVDPAVTIYNVTNGATVQSTGSNNSLYAAAVTGGFGGKQGFAALTNSNANYPAAGSGYTVAQTFQYAATADL